METWLPCYLGDVVAKREEWKKEGEGRIIKGERGRKETANCCACRFYLGPKQKLSADREVGQLSQLDKHKESNSNNVTQIVENATATHTNPYKNTVK